MVSVTPSSVKSRYNQEVTKVFKEFETFLYNHFGIAIHYLKEPDRRRVLELERRIRMIGLPFTEGLSILMAYWFSVCKPKAGRMPVRVLTLLSVRSMEVLEKERRSRYPTGVVFRQDPVQVPPASFTSIKEWVRHLKQVRLRDQKRVRRNYRN